MKRIIIDEITNTIDLYNDLGRIVLNVSDLTQDQKNAIVTFESIIEQLMPQPRLKQVKSITTKIPEGVTNIAFSVMDDADFNSLIYYENSLTVEQRAICDNFISVMPKFIEMKVNAVEKPAIIISDGVAKTFIEYGDGSGILTPAQEAINSMGLLMTELINTPESV